VRILGILAGVSCLVLLAACGGSGGSSSSSSSGTPATPTITLVTVSCSPTPIQSLQTSQCTALVSGTGNFSSTEIWTASGGGTINASSGLFTAAAVRSSTQVTITATSAQDLTKSGSTGLTVTAQIPHAVDLSWVASNSPAVAGYNAYRSTVSGGPYTKLNSSLIANTSYTDQMVQSGHTYYYVASAVDSQGLESIYSNEAVVSVP